MDRLDREVIHMFTAYLWATRATCKQNNRKVGCVITTQDLKRVLAVSYNGPPQQLSNDACRNISGDCGCGHSEVSGIARSNGNIKNKVMFVTMQPCEVCSNLITHANISKVYYCDKYRNTKGIELLIKCNIEIEHFNLPCRLLLRYPGAEQSILIT